MAAGAGRRSATKRTRSKGARPKSRAKPESLSREAGAEVESLALVVSKALEADDLSKARRSFTEYREQLLAHLSREEDVTFPAAERRAPAQGGPIRSLRVAHIGIRNDLERVAAHLAHGHTGAAWAVYRAFLETFAAHERLEDQLVELLRDSS